MASLRALQLRVEYIYEWAIRSWVPAMLVILVTFALATSLLDDYPILPDGLRSIATAGGLEAESDLASMIEKLTDVSQQHVPGYFLALFVWGKIAGLGSYTAAGALGVFRHCQPGAHLSSGAGFRFAGSRAFLDRDVGVFIVLQPLVLADSHVHPVCGGRTVTLVGLPSHRIAE